MRVSPRLKSLDHVAEGAGPVTALWGTTTSWYPRFASALRADWSSMLSDTKVPPVAQLVSRSPLSTEAPSCICWETSFASPAEASSPTSTSANGPHNVCLPTALAFTSSDSERSACLERAEGSVASELTVAGLGTSVSGMRAPESVKTSESSFDNAAERGARRVPLEEGA